MPGNLLLNGLATYHHRLAIYLHLGLAIYHLGLAIVHHHGLAIYHQVKQSMAKHRDATASASASASVKAEADIWQSPPRWSGNQSPQIYLPGQAIYHHGLAIYHLDQAVILHPRLAI
jgi:hypothetical protein